MLVHPKDAMQLPLRCRFAAALLPSGCPRSREVAVCAPVIRYVLSPRHDMLEYLRQTPFTAASLCPSRDTRLAVSHADTVTYEVC
jgi:hypothetical protein